MIENEDRLSNEQKIENLMNWLTVEHPKKMKISSNVKISTDAYGGIGLYYEQNEKLSIMNEIIHVPSYFFINKLTCLKHFEKKIAEKDDTWYKYFSNHPETAIQDIKDNWNSFDTIILYIYVEWFCSTFKSFHLPFFQTFPSSKFFEDNIPVLQVLNLEDKAVDTAAIIEKLPVEFKVEFEKLYKNIKSTEAHLIPILINNFDLQKDIQQVKKRIRYIYMCINSRCLYYKISTAQTRNEDNLTLVPLVDFINHSNKQYEVNARAETTINNIRLENQDYKIFYEENDNKEILFKYGHHSDDLLLNDYGFILNEENENNHIDVTEIVLKKINEYELDYLKEINVYKENDRFCINSDKATLYPNTQIAIYMISLNHELSNLKNLKTFAKPKQLKLNQFMKSRRTNSEHYQNEIKQILQEYDLDLQAKYQSLKSIDNVPSSLINLIEKRIIK